MFSSPGMKNARASLRKMRAADGEAGAWLAVENKYPMIGKRYRRGLSVRLEPGRLAPPTQRGQARNAVLGLDLPQ